MGTAGLEPDGEVEASRDVERLEPDPGGIHVEGGSVDVDENDGVNDSHGVFTDDRTVGNREARRVT